MLYTQPCRFYNDSEAVSRDLIYSWPERFFFVLGEEPLRLWV
jgi:hypothetical protein